jgi:GTP cyclohydrolase I
MNAPEKIFLPDVQASRDERNIVIQKVGIKAVRHPVQIKTKAGSQASVAMIDMTVKLPSDVKGTHMSRFLEVLQNQHAPLEFDSVKKLMSFNKRNVKTGTISSLR